MRALSAVSRLACLVLVLVPILSAQQRIASRSAFDAGCSAVDLGGIDVDLGFTTVHLTDDSPARLNPEWAVIPNASVFFSTPPQVVEGIVSPQDPNESPKSQSTSEVAEEDIGWTHFTHDYTFKLTPDPKYQYVLTYHNNADGTISLQPDMEVEWENATLMDEHEGFQRIWGGVPEFVMPGIGDRIWVEGRWIFDCGHPGSTDPALVHYETEIHPPRALVTYRRNHPALDSFPLARVSEPNNPGPQSYLPVTGEPQSGALTFPTWVPLTEADIYVSGNGGGANDICSFVGYPCSGHSNPVIPVNDRNYVFDIYPPGTDFNTLDNNGNFAIAPPVTDASLQYRIVNHFSELPKHACGGSDTSGCATVDPIICLVDGSTKPPDQTETGCPAVPDHPTRLRVILPFKGSNANFFAQSVLLGWDDVPSPANSSVRMFRVRLHKFSIQENGSGPFNDGDWRVFLSVGGQWRYMSPYFDTNANGGTGIKAFDGGDNKCNGDALTENGDDDCFQFDNTPFTVSVANKQSIHVSVGGFISRDVEDSGSSIGMCRNYPGGCDPPFGSALDTLGMGIELATNNDDRIGTYEFDLTSDNNYAPTEPQHQIAQFGCTISTVFGCNIQYTTDFSVEEVSPSTPPASGAPTIGTPKYIGTGTFITSATPITLTPQTSSTNFQYRFHKQGAPLPTYSAQPFPVHWTSSTLPGNLSPINVFLNGVSAVGDGTYDLQYSAEQDFHLLEPRHTTSLILDNTPPVITITQPGNTAYGHSDSIVLNYKADDGTGSGVQSTTPTLDAQSANQFGASLDSGRTIYLESMSLGAHTFSVSAKDNVNNSSAGSVTFTIVVTPQSLLGDVNNLVALGCIQNIGQSLSAKISAAQNLISKGQTQAAVNTLAALIQEVQAQSGKHISTSCKDPNGKAFDAAQLLLEDARYLQASIGGQLAANPILGWVVDSTGAGVGGVALNLADSTSAVIATATTDDTGFYYFATSSLANGANYTLKVTVPTAYSTSTPASQTFTWSGSSLVENFALN